MNMISAAIAAATAAPSAAESMLATRAVLARPTIRVWTARKLDKRATAETLADHGAAADAGRFHKTLVARSSLAEIAQAAGAARTLHYARTLPWGDDGARILPTALYADYLRDMRSLRHQFDGAVSAFVATYDAHRDAARASLGSLFAESDYPTAREIAGRFGFDVAVYPVPQSTDFRVEVGDAVRQDLAARVEAAVADAMRDAAARLVETVKTLADRLRDYQPARDGQPAAGIFRDSLVGNLRDLAAVLPAFNLAGDPRFDDLAARVGALLDLSPAIVGGDQPDPLAADLRSDETLRRRVADAADQIAADAAAWF
jgi:hypothetical protein